MMLYLGEPCESGIMLDELCVLVDITFLVSTGYVAPYSYIVYCTDVAVSIDDVQLCKQIISCHLLREWPF